MNASKPVSFVINCHQHSFGCNKCHVGTSSAQCWYRILHANNTQDCQTGCQTFGWQNSRRQTL